MKKKIIILFAMLTLVSGCEPYNYDPVDLVYSFDYAIIDGIGQVEVQSWHDYEDSDMIQITDKKGKTYYTHGSKVILIKNE